jgi:hypothetical protein
MRDKEDILANEQGGVTPDEGMCARASNHNVCCNNPDPVASHPMRDTTV